MALDASAVWVGASVCKAAQLCAVLRADAMRNSISPDCERGPRLAQAVVPAAVDLPALPNTGTCEVSRMFRLMKRALLVLTSRRSVAKGAC